MSQRVLIVDDSEDVHTQVRLFLADEALDVVSADSGQAGIACAATGAPDLILLDVDMPAPNGFEVCKQLKESATTSAVPIIFLTGASSTQEKIHGLSLGAADYVTKPFDPAELRARVRVALRTKYLMDLLAQRAMVDGLTGLWNRAYFDQRLDAELALCRRTHRGLGCIIGDVDLFKNVNDTHGHAAGDSALRQIAAAMASVVRKEDVLCRIGGEEFAILTPDGALSGTIVLAERLRGVIERIALTHNGAAIKLTCSFGVAQCGGASGPVDASVVDQADEALYQAKHGGRNRVAPTATSDKRSVERAA